jgi:hypothetical protein
MPIDIAELCALHSVPRRAALTAMSMIQRTSISDGSNRAKRDNKERPFEFLEGEDSNAVSKSLARREPQASPLVRPLCM